MVLGEFCLSISIQKFIRRNLQVLFQSYDIVRGQHQIESSATMGKTLNVLVALEMKRGGVNMFEYDFFLGVVHIHGWFPWLWDKRR